MKIQHTRGECICDARRHQTCGWKIAQRERDRDAIVESRMSFKHQAMLSQARSRGLTLDEYSRRMDVNRIGR